jgi:hypothetical protein
MKTWGAALRVAFAVIAVETVFQSLHYFGVVDSSLVSINLNCRIITGD